MNPDDLLAQLRPAHVAPVVRMVQEAGQASGRALQLASFVLIAEPEVAIAMLANAERLYIEAAARMATARAAIAVDPSVAKTPAPAPVEG